MSTVEIDARVQAALAAEKQKQAEADQKTVEAMKDGEDPTPEQLAAMRRINKAREDRERAARIKEKADKAQARSTSGAFQASASDDEDDDFKPNDTRRHVKWPELGERRGNNEPRPLKGSTANVRQAIEELNLTCSHDYFLDVYKAEGLVLGDLAGEVSDPAVRRFIKASFDELGFEPGKDAAYQGIYTACEDHRFNSLTKQLDPLVWDGVPRLDEWFTTYLGVRDNELHRAWARLWLMAAIRRAYDPGCKFDHIPVFEAPEGTDKSSFLKVLACGQADQKSEYFSDSPILHLDEKKQQEATAGVWFYELAEMSGHRQGDDLLIKSFVTREAERARPAYGRSNKRQWRIALFAGTYNPEENGDVIEYLNIGDFRRWWPTTVADIHPIDIPALQRDRWQLFAEAKQAVMSFDELGEPVFKSLHLPKQFWAPARIEQAARQKKDPYADVLAPLYPRAVQWMKEHKGGMKDGYKFLDYEIRVASRIVLKELPPGAQSIEGGRRVPRAMAANGWHHYKANGVGWYKHSIDGSENEQETDVTDGRSTAEEDFGGDPEPLQ